MDIKLGEDDFLITHVGEGRFEIKKNDGTILDAGSSLRGMIRFTYFEDYELPELGWSVMNSKLLSDYFPKLNHYILTGKEFE